MQGLGTVAIAGAALGGYAFGIEPRFRLRHQHYRLTPPGWTPGLKLRISVLADLHAGEPYMPPARIGDIVQQTNALKPDVTVLLGDYAASHRLLTRAVSVDEWAGLLKSLEAPLGVHAVLGNHDWWDDVIAQRTGRGPVLGRIALEKVGIPVYENDSVRLQKGQQAFWLAGLGDQIALKRGRAGRRLLFKGMDDLPATLAKVTDAAPVILLAHEPDIFTRVPARVSLTLSGHTHGGQVRLFGYSPVVPSEFGNRFAYGHIVEDNRHLIVSGGLGCSILPVRFGMPPEIVVIDLGA